MTTSEFAAALVRHLEHVIPFLAKLLCTTRITDVGRHVERLKQTPLETMPDGCSELAALLLHVHSVVRDANEQTDRKSTMITVGPIGTTTLDEGVQELATCEALQKLSSQERFAVALLDRHHVCRENVDHGNSSTVELTLKDIAFVMSHEFDLSPDDCIDFIQRAFHQFSFNKWVVEQTLLLESRIITLGAALERRSGPQVIEGAQHLIGLIIEELKDRLDERPEAPETSVEELLAEITMRFLDEVRRDDSPPLGLDSSRARAVLNELFARNRAKYALGGRNGTEHLTMLTYNSRDQEEVREVFDVMASHCAPRHRIWADWEGIDEAGGQDPFLLTAAVILVLSQSYVICMGPRGLGKSQRWEAQAAEYLCRREPRHRRVAAAHLPNLPEDATLSSEPDDVFHVDLRPDVVGGTRVLVDYLTATSA